MNINDKIRNVKICTKGYCSRNGQRRRNNQNYEKRFWTRSSLLKKTGKVEEVRIVPVGNEFTLEGLCATREKFDKVAEFVAQRLTVDENGEFILRELTTEEFEEIEKALYKEGSRKVIATLEGD